MHLDQFFKTHTYITQAGVAERAGLTYTTLRQVMFNRNRDPEAFKLIVNTIRQMGQELVDIALEQEPAH
jgi:hypothetical protein